MIKIIVPALILLLSGCNETNHTNYDGKKLLKEKCSACHNLDMPPKTSKDEKAPPMMAVSFHVFDFVKPVDESERKIKAVEFVIDYVENPSIEKSFCDKESLKRYGLMPSQKDKINEDETRAIANYMFEYFTPKNLSKIQKDIAKFNALPKGERLALKHKCFGCHRVDKKIVGPSFQDIAKRYKNKSKNIKDSIKNGSKGKWKESSKAIMPKFKNIDDKELNSITKWIVNR